MPLGAHEGLAKGAPQERTSDGLAPRALRRDAYDQKREERKTKGLPEARTSSRKTSGCAGRSAVQEKLIGLGEMAGITPGAPSLAALRRQPSAVVFPACTVLQYHGSGPLGLAARREGGSGSFGS